MASANLKRSSPRRGRCHDEPKASRDGGGSRPILALIAAALIATPAAAMTPIVHLYVVKNATAAPIRCFVMEGGPVTKLVTLKPGQERTARMPRTGQVSLACPKVRDTVFGPLPAGRYEFRKARGRTDLVPTAP